jgi:hypothetical protein
VDAAVKAGPYLRQCSYREFETPIALAIVHTSTNDLPIPEPSLKFPSRVRKRPRGQGQRPRRRHFPATGLGGRSMEPDIYRPVLRMVDPISFRG